MFPMGVKSDRFCSNLIVWLVFTLPFSGFLTHSLFGSPLTSLTLHSKAVTLSFNKCVSHLTHIQLSSSIYNLMTNVSLSTPLHTNGTVEDIPIYSPFSLLFKVSITFLISF